MKSLIHFINEVHRKDYSLENLKKEPYIKYIKYSHKYFEYLNKKDELAKAIEVAFENINENILQIMNDNHISNFINAKMISGIIEHYLSKKMENVNGFNFEQGVENNKNKDISCTTIDKKILKEDIFKDINNPLEFFSIELKCTTRKSSITGNKSYAIDKSDKSQKNKQSFYILITYDYSFDENKNITIKLRNAYFGYIVQDDWIYGDTGNSSELRIKDLLHSDENEKNNRIIQII